LKPTIAVQVQPDNVKVKAATKPIRRLAGLFSLWKAQTIFQELPFLRREVIVATRVKPSLLSPGRHRAKSLNCIPHGRA
jgi:hypothetical protein